MNAMPLAGGRKSSNLEVASSPPAEAPMATIGIGGAGGPRAANSVASAGIESRATAALVFAAMQSVVAACRTACYGL